MHSKMSFRNVSESENSMALQAKARGQTDNPSHSYVTGVIVFMGV